MAEVMEKDKWEEVAEIIFREVSLNPKDLELRYPERKLPSGAQVTRIAPSPTGFMHIGGIYVALISERIANQTRGIFYLRIEDTDKKREVEGARKVIVDSLREFEIPVDEGEIDVDVEKGNYGPYLQSNRTEIYHVYVKDLLKKGLAYPDFTSTEELEEIAKEQEKAKVRPGYYSKWAKGRELSVDEIIENLKENKSFTIRLKSKGDINKKIKFTDIVKGKRELPENDLDIVLLKSDGTPTYHLAHAVDDHLMRTTMVLRGEEWFNSIPLHLQLFETLGFAAPEFGHISPIQKMVGSSRRKLSKRKDPEASVGFYKENGYPVEAVKEYLMNLANPGFEDWKKANPKKTVEDYEINLAQLSKSSGALFDIVKLEDISQETIAQMSPESLYSNILNWAREYNKDLSTDLEKNKAYSLEILKIESGGESRRKDIAKFSDATKTMGYFFDDLFIKTEIDTATLKEFDPKIAKEAIEKMINSYRENMNKEEWLETLKKIAAELGYAESVKEYKENAKAYKGHFGDLAKLFRILLVGRNQSPDLFEVMKVMGKDRVAKRLNSFNNLIK